MVNRPQAALEIIVFHSSMSVYLSLGRVDVVRTLIELGARVDAVDDYKETPLFNAAYWGK